MPWLALLFYFILFLLFLLRFYYFFKVISTPNVGLELTTLRDQKLKALSTEPARGPSGGTLGGHTGKSGVSHYVQGFICTGTPNASEDCLFGCLR